MASVIGVAIDLRLRKHSALARSIALALAVAFLSSCSAQKIRPATVHIETNANETEHDETVSSEGTTDFYPNKSSPRETVFKGTNGSLLDATCSNANCSDMVIRVRHSPVYPDGTFQLLKTDDPNVLMLKDVEGASVLGYAAKDHGGTWKLLPDLQQAREYEHKGDTARTVGKVALGVLLVGVLVAAVAAGAAAEANADTVTTRCTSFANSTTCTTR